MGRYVARRLLQMVPVLIGTTLLIFIMAWALPGDPFAGRCGQRPCPDSFIQSETARLHLDAPVFVQYVYYIINLLHGDLGTALNGESVLSQMSKAFPITIKLTIVAVVIQIIFGIGIGIVSALRRGGVVDNGSLVASLVVISLPVFVIGFVLQYVLAVRLGLFPVTVGYGAPWGSLILPGIVLAALEVAFVLRLTRATLLETLHADHVRTAIAKGLPRRMVIWRHVVRNSLIPVITFIGAEFGILLTGAIVTEGIFNIQGIGGLLYQAVQRQENSTVVSVATVLVLLVLLVNLLVDVLYAVLDPRIRYD